MKKEFKIGELVQIRSWEDMTLEFGGHGDTYINTPRLYFLSNMRYLCKKIGRISTIERYSDSYELRVFNFADLDISRPDGDSKWYITPDMIAHLPMENQL